MHDQMVRLLQAVGRRSWHTKSLTFPALSPWRKKPVSVTCMSYSVMKKRNELESQKNSSSKTKKTKTAEQQKSPELSFLARKIMENSESKSGLDEFNKTKAIECEADEKSTSQSVDQLKKRLDAFAVDLNAAISEPKDDTDSSEYPELLYGLPTHKEYDDSVESIIFMKDLAMTTTVKPSPLLGTEDPSVLPSNIPCVGCGAMLQCQHKTFPGFLPSEHYKLLSENELKVSFCQRCHYIRQGNAFVEVTVEPEEFGEMIAKIRPTRSVVVMVVDVMDMRGSIIPNLMEYIGNRHPLVIVGNKADLIAPDGEDYLRNVRKELEKTCIEAGLQNIHKCTLISAKTGYGIEKLINLLFSFYKTKVDVFIVGTANVGKSSLFNMLLASDYCKNTARDLIQRATISVWPGTTLNLLKFPIMKPTPRTAVLRQKRLRQELAQKRELKRIMKMRKMEKALSWELKEEVGMTDVRTDGQRQADEAGAAWGQKVYGFETSQDGTVRYTLPEPTAFDPDQYSTSYWTYDTPGIINPDQIMNLLTREETPYITSPTMIVPRCLFVKPGDTIFVSGLARLDYVQGTDVIILTVHTGPDIPIQLVATEEADQFYEANVGTPTLGIPLGDKDRLLKIPSLIGKEFTVQSVNERIAVADIQLSSLGWISVAPEKNEEVIVRAYTPGMKGLNLRSPALIPRFTKFKGKRMGKTQFFHTCPPGSALANKDVDIRDDSNF